MNGSNNGAHCTRQIKLYFFHIDIHASKRRSETRIVVFELRGCNHATLDVDVLGANSSTKRDNQIYLQFTSFAMVFRYGRTVWKLVCYLIAASSKDVFLSLIMMRFVGVFREPTLLILRPTRLSVAE